jgi:hypothetical protein
LTINNNSKKRAENANDPALYIQKGAPNYGENDARRASVKDRGQPPDSLVIPLSAQGNG